MPRVCVVGSANVDYAVTLPRLPRPGETVTGGELLRDLGGKGANQAVAARRLGAEVRFLGGVGADAAGEEIRAQLAALGIGVEGLVTVPATTGAALIFVDAAGANQIAVAPGANHALTVEALAPHAEALAWAEVVVCQLELSLPVVRWALAAARREGVATILNPAPAQELDDELLHLVRYLTPNEGEAGRLAGVEVTGLETARQAGDRLVERGAAVVIVTLGAEGALVCGGEGSVHHPAFPVTAVDTTAAGDAFTGALAAGVATWGSLEQALPLANAAAALTCTRPGAQASLPDRATVDRFLRELRR
jgi:ribokinase